MVLNKEITAIQKACFGLHPDYQPGITYFVAQKRHHTRLFPENSKEGLRNGNILPGTVVDTDIIHPTVSSFFLASHEGIQGMKKTSHEKLYCFVLTRNSEPYFFSKVPQNQPIMSNCTMTTI